MNKKKVYIGIDPGKKGFIVALYGDNTTMSAYPMPMVKTEYDLQSLKEKLHLWNTDEFDVHVVLEDVHAIFGAAAGATFEFGRGLGILEMGLEMIEYPYTKVQPKKWQSVCFEGIPEIRKAASPKQIAAGKRGGVDTKAMALLAVKRLFPTTKLSFGKAEKPNEGFIDALLMAHYCKQTFNK